MEEEERQINAQKLEEEREINWQKAKVSFSDICADIFSDSVHKKFLLRAFKEGESNWVDITRYCTRTDLIKKTNSIKEHLRMADQSDDYNLFMTFLSYPGDDEYVIFMIYMDGMISNSISLHLIEYLLSFE